MTASDTGFFIGFGEPVRGREKKFGVVFNEAMEYFSGIEAAGEIDSHEFVFLEHTGTLAGFILLRGTSEKISRLRGDEEFNRLLIRISLVADHLDAEGAEMGDRIQRLAAYWDEQVAALT